MHTKTTQSKHWKASARSNRWYTIQGDESIARARHNGTDKPKTKCDDCGEPIEGEPVRWEDLTLCEVCG